MTEDPGYAPTELSLAQVWLTVAMTFFFFVFATMAYALAVGLPVDDPAAVGALARRPSVLLSTIALSSVTFAAVAVWMARIPRSGASVPDRLGWVGVHPAYVAVTVLGTLGLGGAVDGLVALLGLRETGALMELRSTLSGLSGLQLLGAAAVIGLGPGLGEELFFRGFIMKRLLVVETPLHAIVASSVAFGLFHWDPVHTPAAALMGLYLAAAVWRTGSLVPAVFAHAANNTLATLTVRLPVEGGGAAVSVAIGTAVAALAMIYLWRKTRSSAVSRFA